MKENMKENMSGYQSPSCIVKKMESQFHNVLEKYIMQVVQNFGIMVDKDELLKALDYDRKQYEKGYREGYRAGKLDAVVETCEEYE